MSNLTGHQANPYKAVPQHEILVAQEYNGPIYGATAISEQDGAWDAQHATPIPQHSQPPQPVYYGSWRDDQVEVVRRGDDMDLYCSLFIVFFFFFIFIILIIVVSVEYSDDDYY